MRMPRRLSWRQPFRAAWPDRRLLAPEVVQTSAMDCGPAALKSLLEGFGIPVSYPRLQDACHTDLDGTSIDTLEQITLTLGLEAEQIMVPADHVLLEVARTLPALVVTRRENASHFLVVWRRHGPFVQVMDPAKGRRWLTHEALVSELYVHTQRVAPSDWREWAGSAECLASIRERLGVLGVSADAVEHLVDRATTDTSLLGLATLDASTRMASALVRAGGVKRGGEAAEVLETIAKRVAGGENPQSLVPPVYWSVLPDTASNGEQIFLRGSVLLRARARSTAAPGDLPHASAPALPEGLIDAIRAPQPRPFAEMWRMVRERGTLTPSILAVAGVLAAAAAVFEMLMLRGLLEISNILSLREQRFVAVALVAAFMAAMVVLEIATGVGLLGMGRQLEARLRTTLLEKLPRLGDRYFRTRLISDLAHRAHSVDVVRSLPDTAGRLARTSLQLVFTAAALAWLDPPSAWIAIGGAGLALAIPLSTTRMLGERELRQRNHAAALSGHYLDSLLGLTAARTHGAERVLRRRHESLLVEWGRSGLHLVRGSVVIEGLQMLVGSTLAAWLVLDYVGRGGRPGGTLLLVYWALNLPLLGREVAGIIRRLPAQRNVVGRILEPLSAPEEPALDPASAQSDTMSRRGFSPASIQFAKVQVQVAGRSILEDVDLSIRPGEHVAIVGHSGAGKSTLLGLLLGWRAPTSGEMLIDGEPLAGERLIALRRATAWVDPSVHLWNRSLFDNLRYADPSPVISQIGSVIDSAELSELLEKLPDGLQSPLGEGGGLTAGGEGQRVRFGRALGREHVRLALLDEPFRGLDRDRRRRLLARARDVWHETTMLCVTHDIDETQTFDRVLVVEDGRIVEDGNPAALARVLGSGYARLLAAERAVAEDLWASPRWRRWRVEGGTLVENPQAEVSWTSKSVSRGR